MKLPMRGEKGFTLVELLIVVAILGILAAVVIPNVIGLMGRGGAQAYETDQEVLQLASAAFYSDIHAGCEDTDPDDPNYAADYHCGNFTDNEWGNVTNVAGHYLPTAVAKASLHVLVVDETDLDPDPNLGNPKIKVDLGGGAALTDAEDCDIEAHAIWIGLLFNQPGDHIMVQGGTAADRDGVAPVLYEDGPYIQEIPESSMAEVDATHQYNGSPQPGGGYCWVVGKNGTVFGAYKAANDAWYNGFSGAYP